MAFISGSATLPGADHERREPDVLPRRPERQRPGPPGRQLHHQAQARTGRLDDPDHRRPGGLLDRASSAVMTPILRRPATRSTTRATTATTPARRCRATSRRWRPRSSTRTRRRRSCRGRARRNAELFGQTMQQQGKTATLFGTDGTDSPLSSRSRAPTCPTSGPTSRRQERARQVDRQGRREVRPLRPVRRADLGGDRRRDARDRVGLQGRQDAVARQRARRGPQDEHPRREEPARAADQVQGERRPRRRAGSTCSRSTRKGNYIEIPTK